MTTEDIFLVDSNSFMTPYRLYYAFDLVPAYWNALVEYIKTGRIVVLDMVKSEIDMGEDDLSKWLSEAEGLIVVPHVNQQTVDKYQQVLQYVASCGLYLESATGIWAQGNVADPWLIASSAVNGYTLVTEENCASGLTTKNKQRAAKIPDVAKEFSVKTINIYEMMRRLGIVIK